MKNNFKKITATLLLTITFTQIGCATVTRERTVSSLDEVEFSKGHHYTIQQKNVDMVQNVPGNKISLEKNNLLIENNSKKKIIELSDISSITDTTDERSGSYVGRGAWIGAVALGGPVFFVTLLAFLGEAADKKNQCGSPYAQSEDCYSGGYGSAVGGSLLLGTIAGAVGASIGSLIGLTIPKHEQIKFVPIVSPSKTVGTTSGGSLQFTF